MTLYIFISFCLEFCDIVIKTQLNFAESTKKNSEYVKKNQPKASQLFHNNTSSIKIINCLKKIQQSLISQNV
jgi:hypothetical protein